MTSQKPLFEVSWEVANKVGGIHTVVSSKVSRISQEYEEYFCVGPLFSATNNKSFIEQAAPDAIREIIDDIRSQNIHCVYGRWDIPGRPQTLLIDATHAHINWDSVKAGLYEDFGVDTLHAGWDVLEPLKWAVGCAIFIDAYQKKFGNDCLAHFHEWMAGFGLLHLKQHNERIATIFTTHATVLGRSMSANTNQDIYSAFTDIDPSQKAQELGVAQKHSAERACATFCDVFTTVSKITSFESEQLLGRKPDVILPNGISPDQFPSREDETTAHRSSRDALREFIYMYFFGHHQFDLHNTLILFTNGRYEYHNKGLDVLTDALGKLNSQLKDESFAKRIVVFYFIPGDAHGIKEDVLKAKAAFTSLKSYVEDHTQEVMQQIIENALRIDNFTCEQMMSPQTRNEISHLASQLTTTTPPPLCSHYIANEHADDIVSSFKQNGLDNGSEDIIKVIRMPIYLDGDDGLLNLTMEQAAAGCHLGLFPSYYEPWGYTPVESAANGTPAITTDLAGFGRFVTEEDPSQKGVLVLARQQQDYSRTVTDLCDALYEFVHLSKDQRKERRMQALQVSKRTHWNTFIKHYLHAYSIAHEILKNR